MGDNMRYSFVSPLHQQYYLVQVSSQGCCILLPLQVAGGVQKLNVVVCLYSHLQASDTCPDPCLNVFAAVPRPF